MQSYRVINKVINFKKENKHLPILVAKRSREIMVVEVLDVQYGRPGAIVRLQRTLGTQPRPQGLLYGVVSPPKIGCSYTGAFLQISRWGNSFGVVALGFDCVHVCGYKAISYQRERQNLNSF